MSYVLHIKCPKRAMALCILMYSQVCKNEDRASVQTLPEPLTTRVYIALLIYYTLPCPHMHTASSVSKQTTSSGQSVWITQNPRAPSVGCYG